MKYIYTSFFLLIGVFGFVEPLYAQVNLYESYEQGGTIDIDNTNPNAWYLIGSFQVLEPLLFSPLDDTYMGFRMYSSSGSCGVQTYVASTTDAVVLSGLSELWSSDAISFNTSSTFQTVIRNPGLSSSNWLQPSHDYGIYVRDTCTNNFSVESDSLDLIYYGYFSWDGDYGDTFNEIAGVTRIIDFIPENATTTATSTTFFLSASVYVNEIDYDDDMFLRFRYVRNEDLQSAVANKDVFYTTIDVPILSAGFSSVSTTTNVQSIGKYTYYLSIREPSALNNFLGWFGLGNVTDSGVFDEEDSYFIVVQNTYMDAFIEQMASSTAAIFENPGDLSANLDSCSPLGDFNIATCLTALILPDTLQVQALITTLRTNIFTKAPQGYVTRLIDILGNQATTSLPTISYTFDGNSPLTGETVEFDFAGTMAEASVIINDTWVSSSDDPQSAFEIIMPLWNLFVYFIMALMIFHDLTGIHKHKKHKTV